MNLIHEAFTRLYPERQFNYIAQIKYSRKFKPYNARVHWRSNNLKFSLSHEWKQTDPEITIGLLQSLLAKINRHRASTFNIDLYNSFLKKLPDHTPGQESDPPLEQSFHRVNSKYFELPLDQPTLAWGAASTTKLAHYDLHTNTIIVSTIFQNAPQHLLDYIMYHEMLHKKHKFTAGKRNQFHTQAFREDERKFENYGATEKELNGFVHARKRKGWFSLF